jgi:hypothetical protein
MQEREAVECWIRDHVEPPGPIEMVRERPWSTVLRVPLAGGAAWFKASGVAQAFEPRLSAELYARWPDRVAEVLAYDEERAWFLMADAGAPIGVFGNPPEAWLEALPLYAELQRGEASHADDHVAHGVPSLRTAALPAAYAGLVERELPLDGDELARLRDFAPGFAELCAELAGDGLPPTVQHDDLHMANLYERDGRFRFLDWGDSSIAHPFFSLVVTFRFLGERSGLKPNDPWFARLRDAYLEPWGGGLEGTFALALRVGAFAHAIALARIRDFLPSEERSAFDNHFAHVLRRALDATTRRYLVD